MSKDRIPVEGPVIEFRDDEARYRATFQQAAIGIVHTALDGAILDVNPAFCLMFGYERADLLLRRMPELRADALQAREQDAGIQRVIARDSAVHSVREEYRHAGGASVWLQRTVIVATDAMGDPYLIHFAENV